MLRCTEGDRGARSFKVIREFNLKSFHQKIDIVILLTTINDADCDGVETDDDDDDDDHDHDHDHDHVYDD